MSTKQLERFDSLDHNGKALLEALSEGHGSLQELMLVESVKSDERYERSMIKILAKQEETKLEVTQVFEMMDSGSRAEHEATRREIEQLKAAMAQIENDMIRRDEELKELLAALGKAHGDKERQKLQERSNAVTVALCALSTMYESLQVSVSLPWLHAY